MPGKSTKTICAWLAGKIDIMYHYLLPHLTFPWRIAPEGYRCHTANCAPHTVWALASWIPYQEGTCCAIPGSLGIDNNAHSC